MLKGIDVSRYQGVVNWPEVARAGFAFTYVKASEGLAKADNFDANWQGAKAAGLLRGAYCYLRGDMEPAAQANLFAHVLTGAPLGVPASLEPADLCLMLDYEDEKHAGPDYPARALTFVYQVEKLLGRVPILYTFNDFWRRFRHPELVRACPALWIAHYGVQAPTVPADWPTWTFWQQSEQGRVPGIDAAVDLDFFNGSLDELVALNARLSAGVCR